MFAQKFSRNKVELHVRCLSLCLTPLFALSVSLSLTNFPTPFVSVRRKMGEKHAATVGENYKPFFSLFFSAFYTLPPRPKSRYSCRATPPATQPIRHHAFSFYRYRKRSWESFRFHNRILINFRKPNYKVLL